jgi:hypothetical protein
MDHETSVIVKDRAHLIAGYSVMIDGARFVITKCEPAGEGYVNLRLQSDTANRKQRRTRKRSR